MYYVIKNNKTDQFIMVDRASGGYWNDSPLGSCSRFQTRESARKYYALWSDEDWSLFGLTVIPTDWDDN